MKTGPSRQLALHPSVPNEMRFQVCDTSYYHTSGGSTGGAREPRPPLIFRPNWGPKDRKKLFLETALPHPYLRVWMTCTPLPPPLSQGLDLASTPKYHHSPLVRIARIGHFTVTDENDTGVDLVLRQPFLLSYLNHVVLMLTSIFFKHNFYKKLNNSQELKHTNHDLNKTWELGHPLQQPVRQWS